jgi:ribosomal peptide maturation radical SAM protein 1
VAAGTPLPLLHPAPAQVDATDDPVEPARPMRIALVNMPWGLHDRPSIQCGLLKAVLAQHGHDVTVHYLNLDLAAALGSDVYRVVTFIGSQRTFMIGEWLFTAAAFDHPHPPDSYREALPEVDQLCDEYGMTFDDLCRLRERTIPTWLRRTVGAIDWGDYDLIGFTSTFEQQVAVLAAARVIKQRVPDVPIIVGGANVDDEMGPEYLRRFTDLDYVVVGEADETFPRLVAELSHGRTEPDIPGVCRRDATGAVHESRPQAVRDLDRLPLPDYTDYFAALEQLGPTRVLGNARVRVPAEFSRGCWWGQKHHCTFCGLNALGMDYRSKAPGRAVEEIIALAGSLRVLDIEVVDNIIDMRYISALAEQLTPLAYDISLFFEVKANLTTSQVGDLRRAGVNRIQPGIESLSSRVLKIMEKGTDLLTNLRLLKAARIHGVDVGWNLLTGFPGEREADYLDQAALIPALHHLQPPHGVGDLRLDRFSPYFNRPPESFRDIRPFTAYSLIYPLDDLDLSKIAYYFAHTSVAPVPSAARDALHRAVEQWEQRWQATRRPPTLTYQRGPGWIRITDGRTDATSHRILDGWHAAAYLGCGDSARTPAALARELAADQPHAPTPADVEAFLRRCVSDRLAATDHGRYLALALPARVMGRARPA